MNIEIITKEYKYTNSLIYKNIYFALLKKIETKQQTHPMASVRNEMESLLIYESEKLKPLIKRRNTQTKLET